MARPKQNTNIDLSIYREKYHDLFHNDSKENTEKTDFLLKKAIDTRPKKFIDCMYDAKEKG